MYSNANQIIPNLWQGAAPPVGGTVAAAGFTMLVLCAQEYQPAAVYFPGVEVVHAANDDNFEGVTRDQAATALAAARRVEAALKQGRKVLVTCRMGLNRSGLVTGIALHLFTGLPGVVCVQKIRQARRGALGNPIFRAMIGRLGAVQQTDDWFEGY